MEGWKNWNQSYAASNGSITKKKVKKKEENILN